MQFPFFVWYFIYRGFFWARRFFLPTHKYDWETKMHMMCAVVQQLRRLFVARSKKTSGLIDNPFLAPIIHKPTANNFLSNDLVNFQSQGKRFFMSPVKIPCSLPTPLRTGDPGQVHLVHRLSARLLYVCIEPNGFNFAYHINVHFSVYKPTSW